MVVENFEAVSLLDVVVSRFVTEGGQPKNLDKTNRSKLKRAFNNLFRHNRAPLIFGTTKTSAFSTTVQSRFASIVLDDLLVVLLVLLCCSRDKRFRDDSSWKLPRLHPLRQPLSAEISTFSILFFAVYSYSPYPLHRPVANIKNKLVLLMPPGSFSKKVIFEKAERF